MCAAAERVALEDRELHRNVPRTDEGLAIAQEGVLPRAILGLDHLQPDVTAGPEKIAMRDGCRTEEREAIDRALHGRGEAERAADRQILSLFDRDDDIAV